MLIFTLHQEAQRREAGEAREEEAEDAWEAAKVAAAAEVAMGEVGTKNAAHTQYATSKVARSIQVFLFKWLLTYVVIWCVSF